MNEWYTGHSIHGERVLIKFKSGKVRIATWWGETDGCVYDSWQADEGYWYPENMIIGWMPLPK